VRRRIQAVNRAMINRIVQVRLDCDLLAALVSDVAPAMGAVEVVKDCVPRQGIVFLIGKALDGTGDHAVNRSLIIVGVCPPGPGPIPGYRFGIVRPGNPARNYPSRNA
jgi:hypothetical protein